MAVDATSLLSGVLKPLLTLKAAPQLAKELVKIWQRYLQQLEETLF